MDLIELTLLVLFLMLVAFVLGASVMWSLEGRNRRVQPLWLVIARYLMLGGMSFVIFFVGPTDAPNPIIDPTWTRVLGFASLGLWLVAFVAELRHRVTHPDGAGSRG